MPDLVDQERENRLDLWRQLAEADGAQNVEPKRLRELRIYGGAQGIWVDKVRTQHLMDLMPAPLPRLDLRSRLDQDLEKTWNSG